MKVTHVIAGLDACYGGPSACVLGLNQALRAAGCESEILTVQGEDVFDDPSVSTFSQDFSNLPLVGKLRVSARLRRAVEAAARQSDVVHSHGLWLMPNVDAGNIANRFGTPLVVSPHGTLSAESLHSSRLVKNAFWALLQKNSYAKAAAWVASSRREASDIHAFGIIKPTPIIPIGVDPIEMASHAEAKPRRTLLFLSRLHPHKNLELTINIWAKICAKYPMWDLVIAGTGEPDYVASLTQRVAGLGVESIHFTGHVSGDTKRAMLRDADLFILLSKSENFGIAVAEALAAGVPVLVSQGAPWAQLSEKGCGWWVDTADERAVIAALEEALHLSAGMRMDMGQRGRAWIEHDFSWDRVAQTSIALYDSLLLK